MRFLKTFSTIFDAMLELKGKHGSVMEQRHLKDCNETHKKIELLSKMLHIAALEPVVLIFETFLKSLHKLILSAW